MMDKITVTERRDFIIIEKVDGKTILRGSKLFCGVCGNPLAEAIENIELPTNSSNLKGKLKDKTFTDGTMGSLRHHTCGHSMFSMCCGGWKFIPMEKYFTEMLLQSVSNP